MLVNVSCMNIVSTQMDFHHLRNTSFELSQEINSVLSEQASFMCLLIKLQGSLFCGWVMALWAFSESEGNLAL